MRRLLVAVLLSLPLLAQSPEEWDVERRLAERFDEARNAERVAALVVRRPNLAFKPAEYAPGSRYYVIEGERNPELFLPHELFEGLLSAVDPVEATRQSPRETYGARLGDFGWDAASFWTALEELAAGYQKVRYQTKTTAERVAGCRALFDALEGARAKFGKKELDAFLYRSVAPGQLSTTATNERDPAARLRREAYGCRPDDLPGRQAWDWTVDERIAARLVAADRKRRLERWLAATPDASQMLKPQDYVEGRLRPELLLPTEIVEVFIEAALAPEGASPGRADAAERAIEMGLPAEFFPALEQAFAGAVTAHREYARFMGTLKAGQVVGQEVATRAQRLKRDACRARVKGIQTLRAAHGKAFDRFLYEVVAPNVRKAVYEPSTADALRSAASGCP